MDSDKTRDKSLNIKIVRVNLRFISDEARFQLMLDIEKYLTLHTLVHDKMKKSVDNFLEVFSTEKREREYLKLNYSISEIPNKNFNHIFQLKMLDQYFLYLYPKIKDSARRLKIVFGAYKDLIKENKNKDDLSNNNIIQNIEALFLEDIRIVTKCICMDKIRKMEHEINSAYNKMISLFDSTRNTTFKTAAEIEDFKNFVNGFNDIIIPYKNAFQQAKLNKINYNFY